MAVYDARYYGRRGKFVWTFSMVGKLLDFGSSRVPGSSNVDILAVCGVLIVSKVGRMVVCCYSHWCPSVEGERTVTVKSGFLFVTSGWEELFLLHHLLVSFR